MENEVQIFEHEQFGKIRVVIINEKVWFVAADVCRALEINNASQALTRLDNDEKMTVILNDGQTNGATSTIILNEGITNAVSGGWIKNEVNIVNEPGFYRLIFASRKPEALKFQRWVYHEVLPSIRKTGSYSLPNAQTAVAVQNQQPVLKSAILANALKNAASIKQILEEKFNIKDGISSALAISMVEKSDGVELSEVKAVLPATTHEIGRFTPTQIAKKLGLKSAQVVNKLLIEFGLQEKEGTSYILTDEGKKYGEIIPFNNNKNEHSGYQIKWSAAVFSFFEEKGYTLK